MSYRDQKPESRLPIWALVGLFIVGVAFAASVTGFAAVALRELFGVPPLATVGVIVAVTAWLVLRGRRGR